MFGVVSAAPLMTKPIVLRNLIRYNTFRSYLPFNISYIYEPAIIKFKAKISIKDEQTVTEMDKYKTSNSFKTKKKTSLVRPRAISCFPLPQSLKKEGIYILMK